MQISVVMPVWNVARSIEKSVATLRNQTFADFELIMIDDGSTDETPQILSRLADSDARIRILRQPNSGIVAALNLGIREAKGEYIARADGDDLYEPDRLELQLAYLQTHENVVLVCCGLLPYLSRWNGATYDPSRRSQGYPKAAADSQ